MAGITDYPFFLTTEVVGVYGIGGIGTNGMQCQNGVIGIAFQGKQFQGNIASQGLSVGGILGLTASDVQLGAALPDEIPPFFCTSLN
jgi:hypothetical protein